MAEIMCEICPRNCSLKDGQMGFCGARQNIGGKNTSLLYGKSTGFCVDPIEKKPLYHFLPGSKVLSFGTIGCNLGCRFCQNWTTSKSRDVSLCSRSAKPNEIVLLAKKRGCKSIAFTYNEPIIWAEYTVDTAIAAKKEDIKSVAVTAGYITPAMRPYFFDAMDAVNIDLKAFSESFYKEQCAASLQPVLDTIHYVAKKTNVWLELTTLLIPELNDDDNELQAMCEWICKNAGSETPLHFSAFHGAYKMTDVPTTPLSTLLRAKEIAHKSGLRHVYIGNINAPAGQSTFCSQCKHCIISRDGFAVTEIKIDEDFCCEFCGQSVAGVFAA